jgi:hypothetical protein
MLIGQRSLLCASGQQAQSTTSYSTICSELWNFFPSSTKLNCIRAHFIVGELAQQICSGRTAASSRVYLYLVFKMNISTPFMEAWESNQSP